MEAKKIVLRPSQECIMAYSSGKMGIAAVPGSGKTWTLSMLASKIILSGVLGIDQEVLVVTLVNSAVDNFSQRIYIKTFYMLCLLFGAADGDGVCLY